MDGCFSLLISACASLIIDTYDAPSVAACYSGLLDALGLPTPPGSLDEAARLLHAALRRVAPELPPEPGRPGDAPLLVAALCEACPRCRELDAACRAYRLVMSGWPLRDAVRAAAESAKGEPCNDSVYDDDD